MQQVVSRVFDMEKHLLYAFGLNGQEKVCPRFALLLG
jgi:hypothetical protein